MTRHTLPPGRWMVAWNGRAQLGPVEVKVGPHPDVTGWSRGSHLATSGCCYFHFAELEPREQEIALLGLAFGIVAEGVPVEDVLREFARIPEWRDMGVLLPLGWCDHAFVSGRAGWNPHNP